MIRNPRDATVSKKRGGRRRCRDLFPDLEPAFLDVLKDHTAGDPMRPEVRWTNLTPQEIADRLRQR
jgi:hypothetical protein